MKRHGIIAILTGSIAGCGGLPSDDRGAGNWGSAPAVDLDTPSSFDADPTAMGLNRCATSVPPTADCSVATDERLYCSNTGGASIYASPHLSSSVVNHLRTTFSWFDCWSTGDRHAGGNTTWYHTLGDDNGNWGWVPAVNLGTTSAFDSNPSSAGLPTCGG